MTCILSVVAPTRRTAELLRVAKRGANAHTMLSTKHLPSDWAVENSAVVDCIIVKISSRNDWESARECVRNAKNNGLCIAAETHFPKGKVEPIADMVAWFAPSFWNVTLAEADDMPQFFKMNGRWAERIADVTVSCAQSRSAHRLNYRYLDE